MKRADRSKDFDLRSYIVRKLLSEGVPRRFIRHELTLDTSSSGGRADVILLMDDSIHGIELKSGKDVLDRLAQQRERYDRAFDYTHIIIDRVHAKRSEHGTLNYPYGTMAYCHEIKALSSWYGGEATYTFYLNNLTDKSTTTSVPAMCSLLWRAEAAAISLELNLYRKNRHAAIAQLRENASLAQVRPLIIKELRARLPSAWEMAFWKKFDALEAAA